MTRRWEPEWTPEKSRNRATDVRSTATQQAGIARHRLSGPASAAGAMLAGCLMLAAFDPSGGPTLCPFRWATGLWCPGCGSTRMLHQLASLNPTDAFAYNPLAFIVLPYVLWSVFVTLTAWMGGPRWTIPQLSARSTWILAGTVLAYWILRNLSIAPFDALAPPA